MTENKEKKATEDTKQDKEEGKKTLSLSGKGTLSLKTGGGAGAAPQSRVTTGGGRSSVAVEVRRRRAPDAKTNTPEETHTPVLDGSQDLRQLTEEERDARVRALKDAIEAEEKRKKEEAEKPKVEDKAPEPVKSKEDQEQEKRRKELEELERIEAEERQKAEELERQRVASETLASRQTEQDGRFASARQNASGAKRDDDDDDRKRAAKVPAAPKRDDRRRSGKITIYQALNDEPDKDRGPSMAAQRRARERERMRMMGEQQPKVKQVREVVVPEVITVQELANRMAERSGDVVKALMNMGVMATVTQTIDADTAELLISEFGHKIKRVTDADIEIGLEGEEDTEANTLPRPPVVTIMGHVDHGKTSLLDALRKTDVVSGEAGGITQHIGAYQVTMPGGQKITFLDTPGHAAFTEMRARGADVTDIVVLVVAANDSIMPQTIEAISHAKAANKPMIVAINKIDLPDANPMKVKQDLLQHSVVVEELSGDVLCIEVSAKKGLNLDKLEETILLQAEVLDLKANPNRSALGRVVEAKMERGRGSVATVLVQKGTLKIGDIFVTGSESGRVRALINDKGQNIDEAIPGQPVEVLGLNGTPEAGDDFVVVNDEARARAVAEYRQHKRRDVAALKLAKTRSSLETLFASHKDGQKKELPVIIKADVHGSVEAIIGSLRKITEENEEIGVTVLHSGVGGITESDVALAKASKALIVGFNVRANQQARDMAQREDVDIRYYSIIYNVIDDAKAILSGMLAPSYREQFLGYAEIRQVFNVSKVGKVAGCMVTDGTVKRGSKVRLLRDDVVIHEGDLKTLKRFKDEVKDVQKGMECGMAFENYDDIKEGDVIECFEMQEVARTIE